MLFLNTPVGATSLQFEDESPIKLTQESSVGVRTALTRGLAEYLSQVEYQAPGGRLTLFKKVFFDAAEWEDGKAPRPSALVKSEGMFQYAEGRMGTPSLGAKPLYDKNNQQFYVQKNAEFEGRLTIEIWGEDTKSRNNIFKMLEDVLFPVDWMSGFRLNLPHYFGARGTYLLTSGVYVDSDEDGVKRWRNGMLTIEATCPVLQLKGYFQAKPRLVSEIKEG